MIGEATSEGRNVSEVGFQCCYIYIYIYMIYVYHIYIYIYMYIRYRFHTMERFHQQLGSPPAARPSTARLQVALQVEESAQ